MTEVALRPVAADADELLPGVVSTPMALEITADLSFNDWKRLGEQLGAVNDRALWAAGDWRAYGEKFAADYGEGLAAIDRHDRRAFEARAVSIAYPPTPSGEEREVGQRMPGVSWTLHERILRSVKDPSARETWLNEVKRHGWHKAELEDRLSRGAIGGARPPALSLRPVGDVVTRFQARAEALGVEPKELALEVLSLASQLDDPVGVLEAAGAKRELEAAA